MFTANTRSFLGLSAPEPEQYAASTDEITTMPPRRASLRAPPPTAARSRTRRTSRMSAAATLQVFESEPAQAETTVEKLSADAEELSYDSTARKTWTSSRVSLDQTTSDGYELNGLT